MGKCELPVVHPKLRRIVGGQANITRHQTLIARNRHNRSGRVLGAALYIKCSLCSSGIVLQKIGAFCEHLRCWIIIPCISTNLVYSTNVHSSIINHEVTLANVRYGVLFRLVPMHALAVTVHGTPVEGTLVSDLNEQRSTLSAYAARF